MQFKDKNKKLNDELLFLITCCQKNPSEEDIKFIFSFIQDSEFNIQNSLVLANMHGILPIVYKTLKKLNISGQEQFLQELKCLYTRTVQRNMPKRLRKMV